MRSFVGGGFVDWGAGDSGSGIALNLSQGNKLRSGNRTVRYRSALGSVQETAAYRDLEDYGENAATLLSVAT